MPARRLTDGEIALARGIFHDSIDYAAVRVHDRGYAHLAALGNMSHGGHLYLPQGHTEDFSRAPLSARRLFIHESVHVWQHQNRVLNLAGAALRELVRHRLRYGRAYLFHLDPARDLTDYGLEQQAAIIEEYFLRRHGGPTMGRCLNAEAETPVLLDSVLHRFLRDPSYARRRAPRRLPPLRWHHGGVAPLPSGPT